METVKKAGSKKTRQIEDKEETERVAKMISIVAHREGHKLAGSVEAAKIALTEDDTVRLAFVGEEVSLDGNHPSRAGKSGDAILDSWIFANGTRVDSVWVGGGQVVSGGRHVGREAIAARFRTVMTELLAS